MNRVVVVGNGPAAHHFVRQLHRHGFHGTATVLGDEPGPAYNRMMLAAVLSGRLAPELVSLAAAPAGTRIRAGAAVARIDRSRGQVYTSDGTAHAYDTLVLATGARPALPEIAGITTAGRLSPGVRTVRTLADCVPAVTGQVTVLGAGVLGVEVALALRQAGCAVTLVHRHAYPMNRQLDPTAGQMLGARLDSAGVDLRMDARADRYVDHRLILDSGEVLRADTLLLCTGVRPETGLARAAGIAVRRGVTVDGRLRTSDPRICAIGDCAEHDGATPGLAETAWAQADTLARRLAGEDCRYRARPEMVRVSGVEVAVVGCPNRTATERVTLVDPARHRYAELALDGDRLAGAMLVGYPGAIAAAGQLRDPYRPVPANRLAFLLGTPAQPATRAELPDDALVCICQNVTVRRVRQACRDGAGDVAAVAAQTRVTTGCGGCADEVRRICEQEAPDDTHSGRCGTRHGGPPVRRRAAPP
jgi:assimilatory nitrate reductase electron transfer subunit